MDLKRNHLGTVWYRPRNNNYIERVRAHEGITLNPDDISFNAGRRAVVNPFHKNIWRKFAQTPDRTTNEFIIEPRRFYHLFFDDGVGVSDVQHVNDDCLYMSYTKIYRFPDTRIGYPCHYCFLCKTHARLELYRYLEPVKDRFLYCDTDSVIYKHVVGEYNPPLSEFVGGTTLLSTCPMVQKYAIRTADSKQIVKVKFLTIN